MKIPTLLTIIIMVIVLFPDYTIAKSITRATKKDYTSVRVYFVRWDLDTRIALTPKDVRRLRHVYIEVKDRYIISNICDRVFTPDYSPATGEFPEPANLVIDFMNQESIIKTVYANSALIVQEGAHLQKKMDRSFIREILSSLALGLESVEESGES